MGKRSDKHLARYRYSDQPPENWPASKKGVIRYALFNTSLAYRPNGERERARRRKQLFRIGIRQKEREARAAAKEAWNNAANQ